MKHTFSENSTPSQAVSGLNMTPMIDVVFLLLVFFVCTANFAEPEKNLPINVSADGNVRTNMTPLPLEHWNIVRLQISYQDTPHWIVETNDCQTIQEVRNVLLRLKNVQPDIPVIIEPDGNVPMEHVIDIYDICRNLGLTNIRFAASVANCRSSPPVLLC